MLVHESFLSSAVGQVAREYASKTNVVTVCDCVSFTVDVARRVRLRVPLVNLTPYGFIPGLALWNSYKSKT